MTKNNISKYSHIESSVILGSNNIIEDNVVIKGNVTIGDNNYIGAGTVIEYISKRDQIGSIVIGNNNHFASNISIGGIPRKKLKPMEGELQEFSEIGKIQIGNNNVFFENVTIHQPVDKVTIIENDIAIGAHSHIGHDSFIRSNCILSININVGGYVIIGYASNIGMGVNIHQRSVIGAYSMCGMGAAVKGYVLPATIVAGTPAKMLNLNKVGLQRNCFAESEISELSKFLSAISENTQFENIYSYNEKLEQHYTQFIQDCDKWRREEFPLNPITKLNKKLCET